MGIWHRVSGISLMALTVLFMISIGISILALRANNVKMGELRQAVYIADEQGGDIELALQNLRVFVYSHMNTDLRAGSTSTGAPIQLVNRFNAAVAAEQARVAALSSAASGVYADAQARCERSSLPLTARAQCIQDYVAANGSGIPQLNLPPKEFYSFDFASPIWSPDLAGWSLIVSAIIAMLILVRLIAGAFVRWYIK